MRPPPLQVLLLFCKIAHTSFGTPHLCIAMESSTGSCATSQVAQPQDNDAQPLAAVS